jgi:hypothetical protein
VPKRRRLFEARRAGQYGHKALRDHVPHRWLGEPRTASSSLLSFAQTFDRILSGLDLAFPDLTGPERQDLQESHGFLGLLVAFDILYDHLGFAVLRDDQRLPVFVQVSYNFGSMGLQVADGLDLAGQFHGSTSVLDDD